MVLRAKRGGPGLFYLQSNNSTDDNKNHQNGYGEHVSKYWWCENYSSLLYSRNFFTVAPRSLVGPHFPYIIMALEGGNFTFTLAPFSPIQKRNLYLDRIVFKI